jgi:hypothetical protein
MADVFHPYRRRIPFVEKVMSGLEQTCRTYDTSIIRVIWLLVIAVVWMVVADSLVEVSSVEYVGTWTVGQTQDVSSSQSRGDMRTLHRVMRVMSAQCTGDMEVVLAPQVHVDGKPYMYRILRMCSLHLDLVNPVVAVQGTHQGDCVDEYDGVEKHSTRSYPITVDSTGAAPHIFRELSEVCTFMHALSLLRAQW